MEAQMKLAENARPKSLRWTRSWQGKTLLHVEKSEVSALLYSSTKDVRGRNG